ncbi:hypothetical protein [Brucella sp. 2280]|uniref:hypothetical protein n=1 Tax=Brucella sp. 2280 TaxID=2592625 RepID=UPI001295E0F0|nr:hypothetical protein [Brucella sp. 2280]QGA56148.1 hypothetical protein GHC20_03195 [Brucella sp. 2280]QGA56478.1 hypothetical protein GHC20_04990 [Brucella sp. 2280]
MDRIYSVITTETGTLTFCAGYIVPEGAEVISYEEWLSRKDAAGQAHPLSLDQIKMDIKYTIDSAAEGERLKYITPGAGQAMTYSQKVVEAQAFKVASDPQAADYPILSSEVGITAATLAEVADVVIAAFRQWQQIGAVIEGIRLGAKRDVEAATDEAAARAIVDAIVWPSVQMQS